MISIELVIHVIPAPSSMISLGFHLCSNSIGTGIE